MITIISSTNRPDSYTLSISNFCFHYLDSNDKHVKLLRLDALSSTILNNTRYSENEQDPALRAIQEQYILPADKFIFVIPEYNGGVPGILKLFIDELSVWKFEECLKDKKACLIGVSSGRAGNLRGLDYFTNVLHYIKVNVYRIKLPVSSIENQFGEKGELNAETTESLSSLMDQFVNY